MASLIGFDWNSEGVFLVAGRGSGGKLLVEQAIMLPEPFDLEAAAQVGRKLKPLLKEAGVKATSAVAAVGREHLVCKEIHYPDVPAHEVTTIVQFQVSKELTVPPEQAVVDYVPIALDWPNGEKRALSMVLRKDVLRGYEKLCEEAGLKLDGLTARAFALQANWQGVSSKSEGSAVVGILAGGELTVVHRQDVLFSRHLDDSEPVMQELRTSLAAYTNQFPQHPMEELHLAASAPPPYGDALRTALRIPIPLYNPWSAVQSQIGSQKDERFAGACGVLQLATLRKPLILNFRAPKKSEPPVNKTRQYARLGVLVGIFLVLLLAGSYYWMTTQLDNDLEDVNTQIGRLNLQLKNLGDVDQQLASIQEWSQKEIVVLDEIHDLIAVFPDTPGLRIARAHWSPFTQSTVPAGRRTLTGQTAPGTDKKINPVGLLTLELYGENPDILDQFRRAIDNDNHWDIDQWRRDPKDLKKVTALVRIYPQRPYEYKHAFADPTHRTSTVAPTSTSPRRPSFRGGRP